MQGGHPTVQGPNGPSGSVGLRYLDSAYRVGLLALENLGRKISEDRPQNKFAKNPSYGEDVKWLLQISRRLGKFSSNLLPPANLETKQYNAWPLRSSKVLSVSSLSATQFK